MDANLNELYQDIILEHNRNPRNKGVLPSPASSAQGYNPSCGDDITVFVELKNGRVQAIKFDGEGCAISQASASLMTEALLGKTSDEALAIVEKVCSLFGETSKNEVNIGDYGELIALIGVKKFPMRIKCATLAWHAAEKAIKKGLQNDLS